MLLTNVELPVLSKYALVWLSDAGMGTVFIPLLVNQLMLLPGKKLLEIPNPKGNELPEVLIRDKRRSLKPASCYKTTSENSAEKA